MLRWLARILFRINGWTLCGQLPDFDKAVFIAAPHTSNWDGFWFLCYKFAIDVQVRFLAKHSLFWWPLGPILRATGAIPIDRSDPAALVDRLVDEFRREDQLFLALAPEGTRKWRPHWKSGFYRIAKAANVPIVLAFIDYDRKQIGIGPTLPDGRTRDEDLLSIREFYADKRGRHPGLASPVTFAD